jgi:hypothetical protein
MIFTDSMRKFIMRLVLEQRAAAIWVMFGCIKKAAVHVVLVDYMDCRRPGGASATIA